MKYERQLVPFPRNFYQSKFIVIQKHDLNVLGQKKERRKNVGLRDIKKLFNCNRRESTESGTQATYILQRNQIRS